MLLNLKELFENFLIVLVVFFIYIMRKWICIILNLDVWGEFLLLGFFIFSWILDLWIWMFLKLGWFWNCGMSLMSFCVRLINVNVLKKCIILIFFLIGFKVLLCLFVVVNLEVLSKWLVVVWRWIYFVCIFRFFFKLV